MTKFNQCKESKSQLRKRIDKLNSLRNYIQCLVQYIDSKSDVWNYKYIHLHTHKIHNAMYMIVGVSLYTLGLRAIYPKSKPLYIYPKECWGLQCWKIYLRFVASTQPKELKGDRCPMFNNY